MMKKRKFLLALSLISLINSLYSQSNIIGELGSSNNKGQCLSDDQRLSIIIDLKENQQYRTDKYRTDDNKEIAHPLFIWPVRKSSTVAYHEVWTISNYVDQDTASGSILDYYGGSRTYDGHRGTDIALTPFRWKLQEENGAEIIAAAAGEIIQKSDGNQDKSCNTYRPGSWNAVYIRHIDGSIAWYGHMKKESLTSKNVGEMVDQGEYLGIVGSSGWSTGPHLHFELWADDTYENYIDPFFGPENILNDDSWWESQKPNRNPTINALTIGSDWPITGDYNDLETCSMVEITHEMDTFDVNNKVYFGVYLKDVMGMTSHFTVYKPDGASTFYKSYDFLDDYASNYIRYSINADSVGQWTVEVSLSTDQKIIKTFNVRGTNRPVIIDTSFIIVENSPIGTVVGTIEALDADGDMLSYTILTGNTSQAFGLDSGTGVLSVTDSTVLDYETTPVFSLLVQASDGTLSDSAIVTINLTDVEENVAPTITAATYSLAENSANGTVLGTVEATDPDGDTLTYVIMAGNDAEAFSLDSESGELIVSTSSALDFETTPSYSLGIEVSDGALSDVAIFTVNLTDVEEEEETLSLADASEMIYPNPTDGIINIKMNQFKEATIYNLSGKRIMRSTDNRIDVSSLSEGVYIIKLENSSGDRFSTRLIKE